MLWYGYIYYILFNFLLIFLLFYFYKINVTKTNSFLNYYNLFNKFFLSIILFFYLFTFVILNYFLDFYQEILYLYTTKYNLYLVDSFFINKIFYINLLNLNLVQVYYYPFIYIFLLITVLSIIFCLTYNINELYSFMFYVKIILLSGYLLFFTDSIILFFFSYEMLLIPSFFILYKFAKTRRCVEAAYLMFFWTQFGALILIFALLYLFFILNTSQFSIIMYNYFTVLEVNFLFISFLLGFGVKLPIWPFYGWLPKAHVEASTNFSIFLSGVLVKFAFFGLLKCLITIQLEPTFIYVYPFLTIGIVDAVFKLFYQIDLKKLVAYSTVVEMHWLTICIISGQSNLILASFAMLISHALLSTNSFLLVDAISRRFKTRLITEISGINFITPKLFLIVLFNTLVFLGFPGSILFISEFLFFSFFFDLYPLLSLFLLLFLYLLGPSFFFRSWVNIMFGFSKIYSLKFILDVTKREYLLYLSILILMYWLGFFWQMFIF